MKPRLVPLAKEHFEAIVYRPDHAEYVLSLGDCAPAIESGLVRNGGVALLLGEEVLSMAGVSIFWTGVGQLWMRAGARSCEFPVAVLKAARQYLHIVDEVLNPSRLQANVKADMDVNRRFIERLGFTQESLMHGFGPEGADYYLYARVNT